MGQIDSSLWVGNHVAILMPLDYQISGIQSLASISCCELPGFKQHSRVKPLNTSDCTQVEAIDPENKVRSHVSLVALAWVVAWFGVSLLPLAAYEVLD